MIPVRPTGAGRVFLFLQGPSSPLFHLIANRLEALGHKADRINLCAGDRLFWLRPGAVNFRGGLDAWPQFLEDYISRHEVSDIVLLGEERPHHQIASKIARSKGVTVTAIEMGYFRPDWISIEAGGAGSNSHFPDDPELIREAAKGLPSPDFAVRYRHSFLTEVVLDLAYNLPNVFLRFLHPHYTWHALHHPLAEYRGWIQRWIAATERSRKTRKAIEALGRDFFLYPLQLQTDYQMRAHSPFNEQQEAIEMVIAAFARSTPATTHLLLKTHPLDNGLLNWSEIAQVIATRYEVASRVHVAFGGDLAELVDRSQGVVTVNSTVGLQALRAHKPVRALGTAIYDVPGLTDQRSLERFFQSPIPPDPQLLDRFIALLATAVHERGNFYAWKGARSGASAIAMRLHEKRVNQPRAYSQFPPRPRPAKLPLKAK